MDAVNAVLKGSILRVLLDIEPPAILVQLAKRHLQMVLGAEGARLEPSEQQQVFPVILVNLVEERMQSSLLVFRARQGRFHLKIVCLAFAR